MPLGELRCCAVWYGALHMAYVRDAYDNTKFSEAKNASKNIITTKTEQQRTNEITIDMNEKWDEVNVLLRWERERRPRVTRGEGAGRMSTLPKLYILFGMPRCHFSPSNVQMCVFLTFLSCLLALPPKHRRRQRRQYFFWHWISGPRGCSQKISTRAVNVINTNRYLLWILKGKQCDLYLTVQTEWGEGGGWLCTEEIRRKMTKQAEEVPEENKFSSHSSSRRRCRMKMEMKMKGTDKKEERSFCWTHQLCAHSTSTVSWAKVCACAIDWWRRFATSANQNVYTYLHTNKLNEI